MTNETQETPPIGHNNPPEETPYNAERFQKFKEGLDRFNEAAKVWLDLKSVETQEIAEKLNDFLSGAKTLKSSIEKARKDDKKPHIDAGKAVDEAYNGLAAILSRVDESVRPKLDDFMEAERKKALAVKAEEERKAREAREEAERKAREAEKNANDMRAQQEAEEAAKAAEKIEKKAAKPVKTQVGSSTGGARTASFRTIRKAKIVALPQLFLHYRDNPKVADLLLSLANADIRDTTVDETKIRGIEIIEERKSV